MGEHGRGDEGKENTVGREDYGREGTVLTWSHYVALTDLELAR